jgi:hypothetical protein
VTPQPALDLKPVETVLRFDAEAHRYFLDPQGEELPGVTSVLSAAGFIDWSMVPPRVLEAARIRGTHVHTALHFLDDGELDDETLEPEYHGYVMAYLRFKRESGFEPDLVEYRAWSKAHRYAGTLDRTGTLPVKTGAHRKVVLDFKTGMVLPAHRLQLAAYAGLLPDPRSYGRIALELHDDGTYKAHEYPVEEFLRDFNVFCGAVGGHWWKMGYGI